MKTRNIHKIIQAALFAAITCIATMVVHIPVPATGGYLNLGDAAVLLGALLLGPAYGFAAGGVGSMLADLLSGYAQYAPGTLIVKGICALLAGILWKKLSAMPHWNRLAALITACTVAELFMVLGYFFYEAMVLGYGLAALAAVPGNALQAAAGIVLAVPVYWHLPPLNHTFDKT